MLSRTRTIQAIQAIQSQASRSIIATRENRTVRIQARHLLIQLFCLVMLFVNINCERATATIMPYPMTIAKMTSGSALVIKAKVISVEPVDVPKDAPLKSLHWKIYRAKLKVISTLKGAPAQGIVDFLYRADVPAQNAPKMWVNVGPESDAHFKLEPQKSYILFAQKSNPKSPLMQISDNYTLRSWEGFFQAADDSPVSSGATPEQAVWNELTKQTNSQQGSVAEYAALTLLDLSCDTENGATGTPDFPRKKVLDFLFSHNNAPPVALCTDKFLKTLIESIGSTSPYTNDNFRMRYLWTKASNPMCRWSPWSTTDNITAKPAVPFLIKVADGKHSPDVCVAAISALGMCQTDPKIAESISAKLPLWINSSVPQIRAAAIVLSSDYPTKISAEQRIKLMHDPEPQVRKEAALSAALVQSETTIPQLEKLLKDKDSGVRAYAALGLVSFPVDKVKSVLISNISNPDFGVGFMCRVAFHDPAVVRDQLLSECQKKTTPMSGLPTNDAQIVFQNGLATSPHGLAQHALLKYLDDSPGAQLAKPEFAKYLDCMEQNSISDPSLTGAVYEVLLTHKLDQRATSFKKRALATQPTLPPVAFEQPEQLLKAGALKYK